MPPRTYLELILMIRFPMPNARKKRLIRRLSHNSEPARQRGHPANVIAKRADALHTDVYRPSPTADLTRRKPGARPCPATRTHRRGSLAAASFRAPPIWRSPALGAGTSTTRADGTIIKNNRIKQSIVRWCFDKHWNIEQLCRQAKRLGCTSVELVDPKDWPILKKHGLICAIAGSHGFEKGMNNPKYQDMCIEKMRDGHRRLRRGRLSQRHHLHRLPRGYSRRRRSQELRGRLQEDRRLRGREKGDAVSGDAQQPRRREDEGPSRLPGRSHRLLHAKSSSRSVRRA